MDNPETLATLDNQDTGHKTQKTKKISNTDPSIISEMNPDGREC
jgi:hypothetical protein